MCNLAVLAPSRKRINPGDIFVMLPPDGRYVFGRVVDTDLTVGGSADVAGLPNCILIYVFKHRSTEKASPSEGVLTPVDLLIPPTFINRLPWSRGYFETIDNRSLRPDHVLPVHCFEDPLTGGYVDERGRPLPEPISPVGTWGLGSYRTVDDEVSEALGIPLAPDG